MFQIPVNLASRPAISTKSHGHHHVVNDNGLIHSTLLPEKSLLPVYVPDSQIDTSLESNDDAGPHIALPTDVFQDFEALKSVTKLDSSRLMRKLLRDYQR